MKRRRKTATIRNMPLFSIKLKNAKSRSSLMAHVYRPARQRIFDREKRIYSVRWDCFVRFNRDGSRKTATASGPDWLASVLLAVEFVRMQIPETEDRDWTNATGGEAWAILPRRLPVTPGYALYRRLANFADTEEQKYSAKHTREREAAERKAWKPKRRRRSWPDPERRVTT
ncbi:MAG: hypothetical protein ACKVP5_16610 [Aestuariivirga sp.]